MWKGASVTYETKETRDNAMKRCFAEKFPLICISVVDHLARIEYVESKWSSEFPLSVYHGTCIIVECIRNRISRYRIQDEFTRYGKVLKIEYVSEKQVKKAYQVTYESTVSAVAAALALDGRTLFKFPLRTKIKMTKKELFIHRKVCELL